MAVTRQHLIDPEICIRCNTCEESCPIDAIVHNDDNYVVLDDKCDDCMSCVSPCPTGAIDNWRTVEAVYTIEEQYEWDELPEEIPVEQLSGASVNAGEKSPIDDNAEALESEANDILEIAHSTEGRVIPPFSAAHPFINIYTRDKPAVATIAGNYSITDPESESDIHHIVLEFGETAFPVLEGQSFGIVPPGLDVRGKPHTVRLYSVASPRDGERPHHNNVAITVKRVVTDVDGVEVKGVASNYMCDLEKGSEVQVTGPFGSTFLMPNHPEANIIMICTGTGSAPFRAMTERRRRTRKPEDTSRMLLFFGSRTKAELPYFGPLTSLPDSLIEKELVFSRENESNKEYVQDRILKRGDDIAGLLKDSNTYIYVCGLKGMETGVHESLSSICRANGLDWKAVSSEMRTNGRLHIETY